MPTSQALKNARRLRVASASAEAVTPKNSTTTQPLENFLTALDPTSPSFGVSMNALMTAWEATLPKTSSPTGWWSNNGQPTLGPGGSTAPTYPKTLYTEDFSAGTIPSGYKGWQWSGAGGTRVADDTVLSIVSSKLRISSTTTTKPFAHTIKALGVGTSGHTLQLTVPYTSAGGGVPSFGVSVNVNGSASFVGGPDQTANSSGTYTATGVVPDGDPPIYLVLYDDAATTSTVDVDSVTVADLGPATPSILSSPDIFSWSGVTGPITHPITTDLAATLSIQSGLDAAEFTLTANGQGIQVLSHATGAVGKSVKIRAANPGDASQYSEVVFTSRQRAKPWSGPMVAMNYQGFSADNHPYWQVDYSKADVWLIFSIWPGSDGSWVAPTYWFGSGRADGLDWAQHAVAGAHAAGKKAVLVLGGSGLWPGIGAMLADPAKRDAYAAALIAEAELVGADGFDLDFERPGEFTEAEWLQIIAFVKKLRQLVQASHPTWTVSADINGFYNYDWKAQWMTGGTVHRPAFISYLDWVCPMVIGADKHYDSGWKSGFMDPLFGASYPSGIPVDLHNVNRMFQEMGFHASKFIMGCSLFVDAWGYDGGTLITGPSQSLEGAGLSFVSWESPQSRYVIEAGGPYDLALAGHTVTDHYDNTFKASYRTISPSTSSPQGGNSSYILYEGAQDYRDKGEYCLRTGLLGVGVWGLHNTNPGTGGANMNANLAMVYNNVHCTTGSPSANPWPV